MSRVKCWTAACCLSTVLAFSAAWADSDRTVESIESRGDATSLRVERLIRELAAAEYPRRKQAAAQLRGLGLLSLDQLLEAQLDENPEVSLAAQKLVGQAPVKWVRRGDPRIVQYILKDYQQQQPAERVQRIVWLATLEDGVGSEPICRIVRYERSEVLAKRAALQLMQFADLEAAEEREKLAAAVAETLGESPRRPAEWLREFLRGVVDQRQSLANWERIVDGEMELSRPGRRSSDVILSELLRWYAGHAIDVQAHAAARAAVARLVELGDQTSPQLLDIAYWLLDRRQELLCEQLILEKFPTLVAEDPRFTYCAAEAEMLRNRTDQAAQLAEQAFAMTAAPENVDNGSPTARAWRRFQSALSLEDRGFSEWAIREYRRLAEEETTEWRVQAFQERAARLLAELLHDGQRDAEAADVLAALLGDTSTIRFSRGQFDNDWAGVVSRMHFFRSEQYRVEGDREKQVAELREGIEADPTDADVLIAMYRLPRADAEWLDGARQAIRRATEVFDSRIEQLREAGVVDNRDQIATQLNQIAWLVANTDGDYSQAVAQSRRSLELRPRSAGSLDTLGRTYFAIGDLENALKYQRRAVKLEPHSQQIRRQLVQFEQARSAAAEGNR